jgi:hypothetical protein
VRDRGLLRAPDLQLQMERLLNGVGGTWIHKQ